MRIGKLLGRLLAVLVVLAAVAIAVVGWVGSERALHPHYYHYRATLADYPELKPEIVTFQSPTGVTLSGRFFAGSERKTIVLANGYGDTQEQMLPIAAFLHRAGFSVLTYDMRARGKSGGEYVTLGAKEQTDLIAAVHYLTTRPDVDPARIGVLGISMGGSVAILAGAQDPMIKAVVDDCGFSDAPRVIEASFEHFIHLPAFPFAPVTVFIASERAGIDVTAIRPMDVIGKISPRPVFVIHGKDDFVVPVDNSERNYANAKQPKELWLVPGAKHGQAHTVAAKEYETRVDQFFNNALR